MKEGWEYKKLREVCTIISGQDYKSIQDDNGLYPIYGSGGLMGYATQFRCPPNTVIIGRKGNINNPILVEKPFWNVDTAFGIVTKKEIVLPKYFFFFCKNYDFYKHNVAVTIPSLRRVDLVKIDVPVPPLSEQKRIVEELDLLSGIIEKQKQQLKELDTLAQSIFYDMFGDPVTNEKGWESLEFEKCIERIKYPNKLNTKDYLGYGKYPIVSQEERLISGYTDQEDCVYIAPRPIVVFGDHTRCFKYISFDFALGADGVKILLPIIQINARFFYYCLLLSRIPSLGYSRHYKLLKELLVIIPPLPLQNLFAEKIEAIEKQKEAIAKSIEETQKLFDYTMDKYFG